MTSASAGSSRRVRRNREDIRKQHGRSLPGGRETFRVPPCRRVPSVVGAVAPAVAPGGVVATAPSSVATVSPLPDADAVTASSGRRSRPPECRGRTVSARPRPRWCVVPPPPLSSARGPSTRELRRRRRRRPRGPRPSACRSGTRPGPGSVESSTHQPAAGGAGHDGHGRRRRWRRPCRPSVADSPVADVGDGAGVAAGRVVGGGGGAPPGWLPREAEASTRETARKPRPTAAAGRGGPGGAEDEGSLHGAEPPAGTG